MGGSADRSQDNAASFRCLYFDLVSFCDRFWVAGYLFGFAAKVTYFATVTFYFFGIGGDRYYIFGGELFIVFARLSTDFGE